MRQIKRYVMLVCGLLMVAQSIVAPVAYAKNSSAHSCGARLMSMADCARCARHDPGAPAKSCEDECPAAANCSCSGAVIATSASVIVFKAIRLGPPVSASGGLVTRGPDSRLRPPIVSLG